jgi:ubiquinone/menaquinone biosynthesis C-methylase UbiE
VVWAIEKERELLPRLKNLALAEGLKNIEVLEGDAGVVGGTHLPDGAFDFVLATNILFSIEHKHEFVAEVRRILKKGGHALVIDWTDSHGGLGPHPDHVLTREDAQKMFEAQNFSVAKPLHTGAYHWGFLARKK